MDLMLVKGLLYFSSSVQHRVTFFAGISGLIYLIRCVLSRNIANSPYKSARYTLSARFFRQLLKLLPIAIPSFSCPEAIHIYILTFLLILRSFLSIFVSNMNGKLLKSLVSANSQQFFRRIIQLALVAIPASLVNSSLDFITHKLSIRFRESLTTHFASLYLSGLKDYRMMYIDRQLTLDILIEEIDMFSTCLGNLFSNLTKPTLDIILFCLRLKEILGFKGPLVVLAWYSISGMILSFLNSPVNKLNRLVHDMSDNYTRTQRYILEYSEEIAFNLGVDWERNNTQASLTELIETTDSLTHRKLFIKTINSIISKYGALIIAQIVMGLPAFTQNSWSIPTLSKDYIKTSSYLVNISKASTRLRVAYKNVLSLESYTEVLYNGLVNLESISRMELKDLSGKYTEGEEIRFENVSIVTPEGELLFEGMEFCIEKGMHTLVQGPRGSGKSAIFRVIGKLWPLYSGAVTVPKKNELRFLCEVPYLPYGSLKTLFAYPSREIDGEVCVKEIINCLQKLKLETLVVKYELDTPQDWNAVLNLKQQQMLNLARALYKKPQFLVMDDCTTALSSDLEAEIYSHLHSLGATIITLSERNSMLKHHNYVLKLQIEGNWNFYRVSHT